MAKRSIKRHIHQRQGRPNHRLHGPHHFLDAKQIRGEFNICSIPVLAAFRTTVAVAVAVAVAPTVGRRSPCIFWLGFHYLTGKHRK